MRYTLKRDDIPLLSQWIKKFDKFRLVEFFGCGIGILRVLYSFIRRSATLTLCARSPAALQTCPRHVCSASPPCPSNPFITKQKNHRVVVFCFGCGIGIRTPTNRVRVCRAAVTQFRNIFLHNLLCADYSITVFAKSQDFKNIFSNI